MLAPYGGLAFFSHISMLTRTSKLKLIKKHSQHEKDTGSPYVQVAILTAEIDMLSKHLQEHPNTVHAF